MSIHPSQRVSWVRVSSLSSPGDREPGFPGNRGVQRVQRVREPGRVSDSQKLSAQNGLQKRCIFLSLGINTSWDTQQNYNR